MTGKPESGQEQKIALPPAAAGRQEKEICYTIGNSVT
jgi:hypothetical protein